MAVTSKLYGSFLKKALAKEIDFLNDTIKVMLLADTYTPDQDVNDYKEDIIANEVTGTNYTTGGATLANKAVAYDGATNTLKLDADDTQWVSSTITARYAVIYDDTPGTDATKPLIGYVDFGQNESSSNGNFIISWNAAGIATITMA
jgi:hypothetical protein